MEEPRIVLPQLADGYLWLKHGGLDCRLWLALSVQKNAPALERLTIHH